MSNLIFHSVTEMRTKYKMNSFNNCLGTCKDHVTVVNYCHMIFTRSSLYLVTIFLIN